MHGRRKWAAITLPSTVRGGRSECQSDCGQDEEGGHGTNTSTDRACSHSQCESEQRPANHDAPLGGADGIGDVP